MSSVHHLIREAEASERLASIVSYQPDKERLLEAAQRLRRAAERAQQAPRQGRQMEAR